MRPTLATPRMVLEPMRPEHLPHLVDLDGDPEVMRHLIGRARTAEEARAHWRPFCERTAADRHGLGFWVGFADGDFVGWWDASPPLPVTDRVPSTAEVGWRLRRQRWGGGLATEGARAVLEHCFVTVGLLRVTAETMAVNQASRGVMRKLGMRHVRTEVREWDDPLPSAEQGEVVYEITREEWLGFGPTAES
ncbi:GNAT family N-acetyltransferase [Pseudactinotalea suaedae]|uniref:GNAT family N-acetyltransferase n=1 Tax=Pseudactinotalea suaedae TaxID=1524924 RepID=UPI001F4F11A6|nr:GNAT family N-acetyltransferase [Pseudactinotalea suaedae]